MISLYLITELYILRFLTSLMITIAFLQIHEVQVTFAFCLTTKSFISHQYEKGCRLFLYSLPIHNIPSPHIPRSQFIASKIITKSHNISAVN